MKEYEHILFDTKADYGLLSLNRPNKRNAISKAMRNELFHFLEHIAPQFKVIIITGMGPGFCAGMDLSEKPEPDDAWHFWEVIKSIYDHPTIFIAAVNGAARGGGLTLVNACDLALASEESTFGMPEITFGGYPAIVGPTTQIATLKKAVAWMVLTGQAISAIEAKEYGLVNRVVDKKSLLAETEKVAKQIASFNSETLRASKKALNSYPHDGMSRERGIDIGVDTMKELMKRS